MKVPSEHNYHTALAITVLSFISWEADTASCKATTTNITAIGAGRIILNFYCKAQFNCWWIVDPQFISYVFIQNHEQWNILYVSSNGNFHLSIVVHTRESNLPSEQNSHGLISIQQLTLAVLGKNFKSVRFKFFRCSLKICLRKQDKRVLNWWKLLKISRSCGKKNSSMKLTITLSKSYCFKCTSTFGLR